MFEPVLVLDTAVRCGVLHEQMDYGVRSRRHVVAGGDSCRAVDTRVVQQTEADLDGTYPHDLVPAFLGLHEELITNDVLWSENAPRDQGLGIHEIRQIVAQHLVATCVDCAARRSRGPTK